MVLSAVGPERRLMVKVEIRETVSENHIIRCSLLAKGYMGSPPVNLTLSDQSRRLNCYPPGPKPPLLFAPAGPEPPLRLDLDLEFVMPAVEIDLNLDSSSLLELELT
ncbi:hypothetical protein PoB_000468200 [Plakobranchus ocellatus]|uniref:Uncharacterized protein n=1 Tax=Plakobranchus ocellatus TaxID=259542 RepID=A0AAV3Y6U5_9GAST|nr:hypothetical protein PoB_000468200 [Plakobranchus ocellatus]